ncbi:MAG: guanylate kinase [Bacteroidales bacterium]|jgi:guanylate kinase|nr:guanylate kinase [Bacteroidales bacterium]
MENRMIIISAPSGAGKTTLVKHLLSVRNDLEFSISACSRAKRDGELDGRDYYFMKKEEFRKKIDNNEFIEWEEVYPGSYYGTLRTEVYRIWNKGNHVIFDVDVVGGLNIKKQFAEKNLAVFIQPPSIEVLETRIRKRQSDSEDKIRERVNKAKWEMTFANKFDRIVVNNEISVAKIELLNLVNEFLNNNEPD